MSQSTLGIFAGEGSLPQQLIDACKEQGRPVFVLIFDNTNVTITGAPSARVKLGPIGEALAHLRNNHVTDIVLAGRVKRPPILSLKPDADGKRLLARLGKAVFGGDDALLRALIGFLEDEGFNVIGAEQILGGLLAEAGILGQHKPDATTENDIQIGYHAAKALGAKDLGQAAIAENGEVLGLEEEDGTDALIRKCAAKHKNGGVLVKAKKPQQDTRADLPSIGPETVERIHAAGFSGIAVEAGGALILENEKTLALADQYGIFIVGIKP